MDARALTVSYGFARRSSLRTQSPAVFSFFGAAEERRFGYSAMTARDTGLRKSVLPKGGFTWWPESTAAAKQLEAYEAQLLLVAGDVSRVRAAPMWRRVSELK